MQITKLSHALTCASPILEIGILDRITEEELEKFTPILKGDDTEDETFTGKEFFERVWDTCVHYGYIAHDYEGMGNFLDTLKIV